MESHPAPTGRTHLDIPLHSVFARHAREHSGRMAVSFDGEHLTYGELNKRANQLAHCLMSMGIKAESRVGVCLRPGLEIIVVLLAILKSGGTYVPIDPDYPQARIKNIVEDAALDITISHETMIDSLGDVFTHPYSYAQLRAILDAKNCDNPRVDIQEQQTAYIFYTSGTTGQPKGIAISHKGLAYYVLSAIDQFGMTPNDVALTIAKFSFSISLFDLMSSLTAGGSLRILPRDVIMDYAGLSSALEGATIVHIGPNLLKGLVRYINNHHANSREFGGLRHVSSGGDFVPAELLEELKRIFHQAEIYVIYGSTEIACMGCCYLIPRECKVDRSFIGKPFAGAECVLLSAEGGLAPDQEVGEICFKGPGIMKGYLNKPELTRDAFESINGETYFRTGDMGRIHASGNLEYLGRRDFQIKLRGQRIELLEVEGHLRQAPGIRDAVVAMAEVGASDSRLIAYITLENPDAFSLSAVRAHLQGELPEYMQPSGWIVLDRMPLNENFKLARKALPPPTLGNLIVTETYTAPRSETERLLQAIWQGVLRNPCVGIHDNFFHIGGDSLMGMNVCMLAAEQGIRIAPSQLTKAPTIAGLAAAGVGQHLEGGEGLPEQGLHGTLDNLSPFILHFLHKRGPELPHRWNVSRMLVARKSLSFGLTQQTMATLGARHDALRLRVERMGDQWQGSVMETSKETLVCKRVDLSSSSESEQSAAMAEVAETCQREVNLKHGPMACMVLFERGNERPQELFFVVHHFAMDVISWKVFWLEFESVYRRLEAGGNAPPYSLPCSYRDWAHALRRHADSPAVEADVQRWLGQDWSKVPPLPKDFGGGSEVNTNGSARTVRLTLSKLETQTLTQSGAQGLDAECILLSGLAVAFGRWQGSSVVHFDRLVHGRNVAPPDIDISRTIGCIISYAPTLLTLDPEAAVDQILTRVSEQLRLVGDSATSIDLYRYLGSKSELAGPLKRLPKADVLINYRGKVDDILEKSSLFGRTYELAGIDHNPQGLRLYSIAVLIDAVDDGLEMRFVYSENLHQRESIEALGAACLKFLRSVLNR